jgi:cytochrome c oxidase subunit 4
MAVHTPEELDKEERRYLVIWFWLAVLTLFELGVANLHYAKAGVVAVLVILALTKAAMVALYYMHLVAEKRTLTWIAVTPLVLCVWLLFMLAPDLGSARREWTHKTPTAGAPAHEAHHD